ncbi:MAG: FAD-dependent thymidylate synthase [Candidatus Aminicenantes bacterium]|nr:FAD-dependent thymidylate synthase [Candidatus Aminicenantes bacterium]
MEIILAGYNVEAELLEKFPVNVSLTPETLSAAYARISRSSDDIKTLRKKAREDVHKARKSNRRIIFDMGHHSVAEHAVFNFDVIGVSRLALEEVEKFRLVSYTEKSQRYVTLEGDYVLPAEIEDSDSRVLFKETVEIQNEFYKKAFSILKEYVFDKYPDGAGKKSRRKLLEGWAKEDARYILSLAAEGQVGVTINARNLEHLFRRFAMSRRQEVREIGKKMVELVEKVAPSLILFPEPSTFEAALNTSFKTHLLENVSIDTSEPPEEIRDEPMLIDYTPDGDHMILASLLALYNNINYFEAYHAVEKLEPGEKENLFKELFKHMEFFDRPPREFELPDFTFQAVISASNFAQLKRHRMATLLSGDYDIRFGNTVPESIKAVGLEKEFNSIIHTINETYLKLKEKCGNAADYILTNSHCRLVVMKMNLREVYHFIRLRADEHAQWDIRSLAHQLLREIKEVMPLSARLLCGKSDYEKEFEKIFQRKPDFLIQDNTAVPTGP